MSEPTAAGPFGPPPMSTDVPPADTAAPRAPDVAPNMDVAGMTANNSRAIAELHFKIDHLAQGVGAVYAAVDHLVKMLSAVQQVASMMPGGRKIAAAMANQNGSNHA